MHYLLTLLILFTTLASAWGAASGVAGGIFMATDTSATNARPSAVTITPAVGGTNLASGVLIATNSVGIGITNYPSVASINLKGSTTNTASYQVRGLDSLGRLVTAVYPSGRINLTAYDTTGGIMALYYAGTPANGNLGGHYAIGADNAASDQHTITRYDGFITDITSTNMYSKIRLGYMEGVNGLPGGVYAYQQPNKNVVIESDGMQIPPPLLLGTNYASAGQIRLPNFASIRARNALNSTDISIAVVSSDDGLYVGNGASLVALQPGGSTTMYFTTGGQRVSADNTYDIGSSTAGIKDLYISGTIKGPTASYPYPGSILTPWVGTNNVASLQWRKAPQVWEFAGITGEWTAMTVNSGSGTTGSGDGKDVGTFTGITGTLTNGQGGWRGNASAMLLSTNPVAIHWRIKTPAALSSASDGYELYVGSGTTTTVYTEPVDGAYFYYLHSVSNGVWCAKTSSSSARTFATGAPTTPPTVAANTWYDLLLEATSSNVNFWVSSDNSATWQWIGASASNIPTVVTAFEAYIRKVGPDPSGTTSRTLSMGRCVLWPQ